MVCPITKPLLYCSSHSLNYSGPEFLFVCLFVLISLSLVKSSFCSLSGVAGHLLTSFSLHLLHREGHCFSAPLLDTSPLPPPKVQPFAGSPLWGLSPWQVPPSPLHSNSSLSLSSVMLDSPVGRLHFHRFSLIHGDLPTCAVFRFPFSRSWLVGWDRLADSFESSALSQALLIRFSYAQVA